MKIGFIGLGAMGGHMAANLQLAGHELRVHDVRREAAAGLVANGAVWADDPAGAASGVEVLFTCLPGPAEVEVVALGDDGVLGSMDAGSVWFDLTTNGPDLVRRLSERFAARGVCMLDAPVSGGPKGAQSRRLALWVGGDAAVFEKYASVLMAMGDEPLYVGPIGQEMSEAMQRGWSERDARIAMTLQEERAGVSVHVPLDDLRDVMGS